MTKATTKNGATVTTTKAGKARTVAAVAPTSVFNMGPATTPAPVAPAPVVALRGGPAVQAVKLTGKVYRTKAAHNLDWWAAITAAGATPTVAALLEAKVPSHFVGYCMRRGYLAAVAA